MLVPCRHRHHGHRDVHRGCRGPMGWSAIDQVALQASHRSGNRQAPQVSFRLSPQEHTLHIRMDGPLKALFGLFVRQPLAGVRTNARHNEACHPCGRVGN